MDVDLHHLVFGGFDFVWERLRNRVAGLTGPEYAWEPVADMWSVRERNGRWIADRVDPAPEPAPVTTIAWRLWHIADCLASYVSPHLGEWPLPGEFRDWFGEVDPALAALDTAHDAFRLRITDLGEDGLRRELGPAWGPYEHASWADLVVHAMDEVAHHGAEVALLRDLYQRLGYQRLG